MYQGSEFSILSSEGKLEVPSMFELPTNLVVTLHPERYLVLYSKEDWEIAKQEFFALSSFSKKDAAVKRVLIGNASQVKMKKKKISLPKSLIELANLSSIVRIVGMGSYIEIMSEKQWMDFMNIDTSNKG